jgi:GT2 family glycosyltransferase
MRSINNLDYPKDRLEVILVGRQSYKPQYPGVTTIAPDSDDFHNPVGLNLGLRAIDKASEAVIVMNDDVILTKNSVAKLTLAFRNNKNIIANAISPCDNYFKYSLQMGFFKAGNFHFFKDKFYTYEQCEPHFEDMMNADSMYPEGYVNMPYLCSYATLISRECLDRVGLYDENFKTGQDDVDYCYRALDQGAQCVSAMQALIWHFGGTTSQTTMNNPLRLQSLEYFKAKWGQLPPGTADDILTKLKGNE